MKVKLKISAHEMMYLEEKMKPVSQMRPQEVKKDQMMAFSIMLDVTDKVVAKASKLSRSVELFDNNKKHDLTLKYHEASTLEQFIVGVSATENDAFKKNLSLKLVHQLNQKLT